MQTWSNQGTAWITINAADLCEITYACKTGPSHASHVVDIFCHYQKCNNNNAFGVASFSRVICIFKYSLTKAEHNCSVQPTRRKSIPHGCFQCSVKRCSNHLLKRRYLLFSEYIRSSYIVYFFKFFIRDSLLFRKWLIIKVWTYHLIFLQTNSVAPVRFLILVRTLTSLVFSTVLAIIRVMFNDR